MYLFFLSFIYLFCLFIYIYLFCLLINQFICLFICLFIIVIMINYNYILFLCMPLHRTLECGSPSCTIAPVGTPPLRWASHGAGCDAQISSCWSPSSDRCAKCPCPTSLPTTCVDTGDHGWCILQTNEYVVSMTDSWYSFKFGLVLIDCPLVSMISDYWINLLVQWLIGYIWSRVKIVYGTFRVVPDVWNEGAS